ncbi:glycosyltransferase [Synechocystis sp. LKSZ1]|uniref:glycosyltransferase n=1 Tax=Synechocystis sp. LKSZ1 TaxID=3144951 RepID=UPI00336C0F83
MHKFIVIDHSLRDLQGHHYECSLSIAEAAQRAGYDPLILAHRQFNSSPTPDSIPIMPVFEVDWLNQTGGQESSQTVAVEESVISWWQDWAQTAQGAKFREKLQGSRERLGLWWQKDREALKAIPFSHLTVGLLKTLWGGLRFAGQSLRPTQQEVGPTGTQTLPYCSFGQSLAEILPSLGLTAQDQVFIHTIGIEQLEELFIFLQGQAREALPLFHILLRRDPDEPLVLNAPGLGLTGCLQTYYSSQLWPSKIRFYTDTEDLVRNHEALSPIRLGQIPIPFRQEKLSLTPEPDPAQPIHLVYLGDARSEKGYQHLPALVAQLWDDYLQPGKVRFTIQSNYNVQGGEPGILAAKISLAQYPRAKVQLIEAPLTPEDYYQLLVSADLVVLPYDPQSYQRTSGVLTEALAAGKPVVVPAGSWLAQQVDDQRGRIYVHPGKLPQAVISALDNLTDLTEAAQAYAPQWRQQQSPDRLLQILLRPEPEPESRIPALLFVIALESIRALEPILRYWGQRGYRLFVLVYGPESTVSVEKARWGQTLKRLGVTYCHWLSFPTDSPLGQGWFQDWQAWQQVAFPQNWQALGPDFICLDNPLCWAGLEQVNVGHPVLITIQTVQSYCYAQQHQREINPQELAAEIAVLQKARVLLPTSPVLAEKLAELTGHSQIYPLRSHQQSIPAQRNLEQAFIQQQLNQILPLVLPEKALTSPIAIPKKSQGLKIAVLYPWGDLPERQSGASQRTGLMVDYLQEQGFEVSVFSIGERPAGWHNQVYFEYHRPQFDQAPLVQNVYQQAYQTWQAAQEFKQNHHLKTQVDRETSEETRHWLPWIYYSFRHDPHFQAWLEAIIAEADAVILEYPFWGALVGPMCQRQGRPLILTAHDVLAKQLAATSALAPIALYEELQALKLANAVITLSPLDQAFFADWGLTSLCIPIGIDYAQIQQSEALEPDLFDSLASQRDWRKPFCLFVGSQHSPNLEAVEQLKNWSQAGGQTWDIVIAGSCSSPQRQGNCWALGKVSQEQLGWLYRQAFLVLIPLTSGTGMSVKTIEAMAYGKVILGTSIAFRGYPVTAGLNCLICDTLDDYPARIQQIFSQPEAYQGLGQQAQQFAQGYDYRHLYQGYGDLILDLIARPT